MALAIAVAQTCPMPGDVAANLDEHVRLARIASDEGAAVALFPELSLTGYELDDAPALAFRPGDDRLAELAAVAHAASVVIVAGAPVRIDGRLYIGAFIITPTTGTSIYTKQRLGSFPPAAGSGAVPPGESTIFEAGTMDPLIELDGGETAAVAVCADIGDEAHPRRAAARGVSAYLAAMFVIPPDFDGDAARMERYAREHDVVAALANFGCASGGLASAGRSSIWSERGELLVRLDDTGSGVAVARRTAGAWRCRRVMQ